MPEELTAEEVLQAYPSISPDSRELGLLLIGDPLFDDYKLNLSDPEDVELRREATLKTLEVLKSHEENLIRRHKADTENYEWLKQMFYKTMWWKKQLEQHVPPEIVENILIDLCVNELDPDFSFEAACHEESHA